MPSSRELALDALEKWDGTGEPAAQKKTADPEARRSISIRRSDQRSSCSTDWLAWLASDREFCDMA